jgi:hypothetical protein
VRRLRQLWREWRCDRDGHPLRRIDLQDVERITTIEACRCGRAGDVSTRAGRYPLRRGRAAA